MAWSAAVWHHVAWLVFLLLCVAPLAFCPNRRVVQRLHAGARLLDAPLPSHHQGTHVKTVILSTMGINALMFCLVILNKRGGVQ
jgi:hypothetical protein